MLFPTLPLYFYFIGHPPAHLSGFTCPWASFPCSCTVPVHFFTANKSPHIQSFNFFFLFTSPASASTHQLYSAAQSLPKTIHPNHIHPTSKQCHTRPNFNPNPDPTYTQPLPPTTHHLVHWARSMPVSARHVLMAVRISTCGSDSGFSPSMLGDQGPPMAMVSFLPEGRNGGESV